MAVPPLRGGRRQFQLVDFLIAATDLGNNALTGETTTSGLTIGRDMTSAPQRLSMFPE